MPRRVLVFDVNETLLDLAALDPEFARVFGDAGVRRQWFQQLLASAFVSVITGRYADFGTLGRGALEMMAERNGKTISDADRSAILGTMRRLRAHRDAHAALRRLKDAGFRLAALTNSTEEVAVAQLESAGLIDQFELVLSAGALSAGCAAAFVARPGQVLDPNAMRPDVVGADLAEVAERIIAAEPG